MSGIISSIKAYFNWGGNSPAKGDITSSPARVKASAEKASALVCAHCHEKLNNCFRSQIDHSKEIGIDIYAVSIVIAKKDGQIANLFSHHTMLIFEGVNTNGKFWRMAHLMGPGSLNRIEILQDCFSGHSNIGQVVLTDEKYTSFDLSRCKKNRKTWTVSREKVELLFTQIMWEQQHPESTPFRFLGEKSLASVNREFLDTRHPELLEAEKVDPKKFKQLCLLVKDKALLESFDKWYSKNINLVAITSRFYIATAVAATCVVGGVWITAIYQTKGREFVQFVMQYENTLKKSLYCTGAACASICTDVFKKSSKYHNLAKVAKDNEEQLRFIQDRAEVTTATSQNCFNWARRTLRAIDIDLPEKGLEVLITIPELYLPNEEKVKEVCPETE